MNVPKPNKTLHRTSNTDSKITRSETLREFMDDSISSMSRREIIGSLLKMGLIATSVGGLFRFKAEASMQHESIEFVDARPPLNADVLMRMRYELKKSLTKPLDKRKWVMVIDIRKCTGCHACTIGCVAENKLPPGVVYRPVIEEEIGEYPNVARKFIPRPCMQCANPPCVPVCPVNATWERPDGVVIVDYDKCIGCRYCITACPYNARTFDFGLHYSSGTPKMAEYDESPSFEYGVKRYRKNEESPIGNARKCHFCLHRIEKGQLPACVTTCIGRATYFGDANDPDSLVSKLIASPNVKRLKEELGTDPRVYYLI